MGMAKVFHARGQSSETFSARKDSKPGDICSCNNIDGRCEDASCSASRRGDRDAKAHSLPEHSLLCHQGACHEEYGLRLASNGPSLSLKRASLDFPKARHCIAHSCPLLTTALRCPTKATRWRQKRTRQDPTQLCTQSPANPTRDQLRGRQMLASSCLRMEKSLTSRSCDFTDSEQAVPCHLLSGTCK
jgi:hypothetical protein